MKNWTLIPRAAPAAVIFAFVSGCSADRPIGPLADRTDATTVAAAAENSYTAIDLGLLPGDAYVSIALALNDRDQVVGRSWHVREPGVEIGRGFLWTPDGPNAETGQMIELGPVGLIGTSDGVAINDRGVAAGWNKDHFAAIWTTDVATNLPGESAVAINNRGYVVLETGTAASLWTPPGTNGLLTEQVYPLGTFRALAINDRGQIVGAVPGGGAVLWQPNEPGGVTGELIPLGSFAGGATFAVDINDKGAIVGYETTSGGRTIALLWEPTRPNGTSYTVIDLSSVIGAYTAVASGINNKGEVAGLGGFLGSSGRQAWVWAPTTKPESDGTLIILGSTGLPDSEVVIDRPGPAINNRGDVAYKHNGHATLWRK